MCKHVPGTHHFKCKIHHFCIKTHLELILALALHLEGGHTASASLFEVLFRKTARISMDGQKDKTRCEHAGAVGAGHPRRLRLG